MIPFATSSATIALSASPCRLGSHSRSTMRAAVWRRPTSFAAAARRPSFVAFVSSSASGSIRRPHAVPAVCLYATSTPIVLRSHDSESFAGTFASARKPCVRLGSTA